MAGGFISTKKSRIMTKKIINLCGKETGIAYCYATEIAFKKYTGEYVDQFDAQNPEHTLYIILAAIFSYYQALGEEAMVKDEDLMYNATPQDLVNALTEVFNLRAEWYQAEPEPEKEEEGKKKKNG